ncbi:MAG: hypothetical protein AABX07_05890 [Nanoarchaeota archaeon]
MAIPSSRRRAGKVDIENRQKELKDELRKRKEREKEKQLTPEEHEARLKALKEAGLIK